MAGQSAGTGAERRRSARHVEIRCAPTGQRGAFRVIDIYRRRGDKLAENWVFIDLLHFWKTHGVDVLAGDWPL